MIMNYNFIVFGEKEYPDKLLVIRKFDGTYKAALSIYQLKDGKEYNCLKEADIDDIDRNNIAPMFFFSNLESVNVFIRSLEKIRDNWKNSSFDGELGSYFFA